jgi:Flp pilus assembly protein TadG
MAKIKLIGQVRRGIALVEAALVMPLLVLVTLGTLEYGWMFSKSLEVGNAARNAARVAARPDARNADVTATATSLLSMSKPKLTGTYTLTPSDVSSAAPGETVTVTVDVNYTSLTNAPLLLVPAQLHASVSMVKEGIPK